MVQQVFNFDRERLSCSICLDLLKDPVTIPCGHNYCLNYDIYFTGRGHVSCDFCTERKRNTVKSCLQCLVSYCDQHLQPHYQSPAIKNHKLVDPSKKLQQNICSHHNEVMKIFCHTDQKCICYLCSLGEHRGHATVPVSEERTEKQKELKLVCEKIQQRIQDRETDVEVLQQEVEAINQSADTAVRDIDSFSKDLIYLIKEKSWDVKQQIRSQQETEVNKAKDLTENMQEEITELERKDAELEQLCNTKDDCQFLQILQHSLADSSACREQGRF
uniref:B box-type domain-containing protein n=1 Tax=Amphiprion percula TaxID=161767 RepID=A0A3P8TRK0_AMPPE